MSERLFDWSARPCERLVTVASLRAGKGQQARHAQVTADTAEEAAGAEAAGIEMVTCRAASVRAVRAGGPGLFVTAALGFAGEVGAEAVLRAAIDALTDGADAVLCTRRLAVVELLASEDVPVMGHLGFVPRKSTWVGRTRAVGKTASEALALWRRVQRLEEAGAFAVEVELVPARLMAEIDRRTGLATVSLGSGAQADVLFLFTADVCGEGGPLPRHARAYGDLRSLRERVASGRREALAAFRRDVASGGFPAASETASMPEDALADLLAAMDRPR